MAAGDVYQSIIEYAQFGQSFTLTWHWREPSGGPGGGSPQNLADAIENVVVPVMHPLFHSNVRLGCVTVYRIGGLNVLKGFQPFGDVVGTAAGDPAPPNVTWIMRLMSAKPGGENTGQMQITGLSLDSITDGVLDPAFLAGPVDNFADIFFPNVPGAGGSEYNLAVRHRQENGVPIVGLDVSDVFQTVPVPPLRCRRTRRSPSTATVV